MSAPLRLRAPLSDELTEQLAREAAGLLPELKAADRPGPWAPSPVEERYLKIREALLMTPGFLRGFRHTFLAAGRHNFPDSPDKLAYLDWSSGVPIQLRYRGAFHLWKMARQLYRHRAFRLAELDSHLVGQPSTYRIPQSAGAVFRKLRRRLLRKKGMYPEEDYHITEAQIRYLYYRGQILQALGSSLGVVLEVGGGFGGLAVELLRHLSIRRYYLVELADSVPLAYFYFRTSFDCPMLVLIDPEDHAGVDDRIIVLPPWKLPDVDEPIDLLINTMSFQHMMPVSVDFYLREADRLKARYLYLVNRDVKRDPTDPVLSGYTIPSCYRLQSKQRWLFGQHVEAVYERLDAPAPQSLGPKRVLLATAQSVTH